MNNLSIKGANTAYERQQALNPSIRPPAKGTDKVSPRVVAGGLVLLPKRVGQAPPPTFSHIKSKENYHTGMGEGPSVGRFAANNERPGATDFLAIQSHGNRT